MPAASPPRPLPIRPRPMTGESPASYLRRLARANHLRPAYLRRYLRSPGDEATIRLDWLAVLAGRPLPVLERALAGPASGHPAGRHPEPARRHTRQAGKLRLFAAIRRDARDHGLSIRALADRHGVHRRTVRQALASPWPAPRKSYARGSKLDPFRDTIDAMLLSGPDTAEQTPPTVKQIFGRLVTEHDMTGVPFSTVRDYVTSRYLPWRAGSPHRNTQDGKTEPPGHQERQCGATQATPEREGVRTGVDVAARGGRPCTVQHDPRGPVMTGRAFPRTTLPAGRLVLRPFEPGDAADVCAVWNDEVYLRFAPAGFPHAGADIDQAIEWCTNGAEDGRRAGRGVSFAGIERDGGQLVSHVALFGTDWTAMITEIHYWTAPWGRGNGYAAEAARAVARWALTEQGFARVTLEAVTGNAASQRVAQAAGFRFEGILRNAALTRAGRGDLAVYSLIPQDLEESPGS